MSDFDWNADCQQCRWWSPLPLTPAIGHCQNRRRPPPIAIKKRRIALPRLSLWRRIWRRMLGSRPRRAYTYVTTPIVDDPLTQATDSCTDWETKMFQ